MWVEVATSVGRVVEGPWGCREDDFELSPEKKQEWPQGDLGGRGQCKQHAQRALR